jgi:ATP citrate (pro-S)-lyase
MVTADHGPAVAGAHNAIVAARAGKDLISSVASGMLTIGPRFGGAIDGAAQMFSDAYDRGLTPVQFVEETKKKGVNIQGIGHLVKSIHNPDMRVTIIKEYAKKHFKATPLLDFALEVEKITTAKKDNLILNVDGCIGICLIDMLRSEMPKNEADEYIQMGALNGLFVVGRTIGMIGHFLDQNRLKQGLYRHPWDDIAYMQ